MAKYTWSETFHSLEGEGLYAGFSTVYARFSLCNLQCKGFNNPEKLDTTSIDVLGFDPKDYSDIYSIPLITRGCDSIYSWDPKFAHMWKTGDENDVIDELFKILPNNSFILPSGKRVIWSITGGEPTLRAKFLPTLFHHPRMSDCNHILIETNCAVPLKADFIDEISKWLQVDPARRWTWSNSPKLSVSGEPWDKAIMPSVALVQQTLKDRHPTQVDQYFKFVCGPDDSDFEEVAKAMSEYHSAGISKDVDIYVMPVACQESDQKAIAAAVAMQCIHRGYIHCHRIHLEIFGNAPGT